MPKGGTSTNEVGQSAQNTAGHPTTDVYNRCAAVVVTTGCPILVA